MIGGLLSIASRRVRSRIGASLEDDPAEQAAQALDDAWDRGEEPSLEQLWAQYDLDGSVEVLAALVKADLRRRFERGQPVAVADYLDRFSLLHEADQRVVSLVYEEYCLREERGEALDADAFCNRYSRWRDSLVSQLRYHRLLSQVVTPSSPPQFPPPGARFQDFRLDAILGRGGSACVYLATDPHLGDRQVVLKVAPDRGLEASIQGRLDHPHIVPALSVTHDPDSGLRGLCMPYRPGLTLDKVIEAIQRDSSLGGTAAPAGARRRPRAGRVFWEAVADPQHRGDAPTGPGWAGFPVRGSYARAAAWIVLKLAEALRHAHTQRIFHRDIKPANVLLTRDDGPKLFDFNLAYKPHSAEQAQAALRGGTLPYMAPEQLEAFKDNTCWDKVGAPADLYSLGLVLRELLTGQRPEAPDLSVDHALNELIDRRARFRPSLRRIDPTIPHALDAILTRCLAFAPTERYASADELIEDLQRFLAHEPLRYAPNTSRLEQAQNLVHRRRKPIAAGVAALAVLGVLIASPLGQAYRERLHLQQRNDMLAQVDAELKAGLVHDAAQTARRLVERHPGHALAHVFYGEALIRAGQSAEDGDGHLRRALHLAEADLAAGRHESAQAALGRLVRLRPQWPLASIYYVEALARGGAPPDEINKAYERLQRLDREELESALRRAVQTFPNSADIGQSLAMELRSREPQEARALLHRVLDIDPTRHTVHHLLGSIETVLLNYDQAYDYMNKSIDLAGSRKPPLKPIDWVGLHRDRAAAAIAIGYELQQSPQADDQRRSEPFFLRAQDDLDRIRDWESILTNEGKARLAGDSAHCLMGLAAISPTLEQAAERIQAAQQEIQTALRLDPDRERFQKLHDTIEARRKLVDDALQNQKDAAVGEVPESRRAPNRNVEATTTDATQGESRDLRTPALVGIDP